MESNAPLTLLHVLNSQCLLPVFRIYCRSQGVEEYLRFWFDARMNTNKYLHEETSSPAEKADCANLFKRYFFPDSVNHIRIDPKIGNELQTAINTPQVTMKAFEGTVGGRETSDC